MGFFSYAAFSTSHFFLAAAASLSNLAFLSASISPHILPMILAISPMVASGLSFLTSGLTEFMKRKYADIGLFGALGSFTFFCFFSGLAFLWVFLGGMLEAGGWLAGGSAVGGDWDVILRDVVGAEGSMGPPGGAPAPPSAMASMV